MSMGDSGFGSSRDGLDVVDGGGAAQAATGAEVARAEVARADDAGADAAGGADADADAATVEIV